MTIVIGGWSDPSSSPTAHSALVAQVLLTMVTSGVLSHPVAQLTCVGSPLLRMLVCLEISPSSTPEGRMGVKIASSYCEQADADVFKGMGVR